MDLIITTEAHFCRTPDGKIWTRSTLNYQYWQRYLRVFGSLKIIARIKNVNSLDQNWLLSSGKDIIFVALPDYFGPVVFAKEYFKIRSILKKELNCHSCYLFHVPSIIATLARKIIKNQQYSLEVLGDPAEVFSPGAVKNFLRPFFRWLFSKNLRNECRGAKAIRYVTNSYLQKKYPGGRKTKKFNCSDCVLGDKEFRKKSRKKFELRNTRLLYIGTLNQLYKGPDILLRAFYLCNQKKKFNLTFVGAGKYKILLQKMARKFGLEKKVKFFDHIANRAKLRKIYDSYDIFLLPSRQEGMPRALLEAMARALPCIGSKVGGIPEVLSKNALVEPNHPEELAEKILAFSNREVLIKQSERNLNVARKYHYKFLKIKEEKFLKAVQGKFSSTPEISVITPVYNAEKFVARAIESILNQTFTNFEFIIIDDASKDNSLKIARSYQKQDPRIKILHLHANRGVASALNCGLKIAKGRYIARIDADDLATPDRLRAQHKYLKDHPEIFLVAANARKITEDGQSAPSPRPKFYSWRKSKRILERRNFIYHSVIMFRNDRRLRYREKILFAEDWDFYLRLISSKKKIVVLRAPLLMYRIVGNSELHANNERAIIMGKEVREFYRQRRSAGRDCYQNFKPEEVINLDLHQLIDKDLFRHRVVFNIANNRYQKARQECLKYFCYFGYFNKIFLYYLVLSFGDNFVNLLRRIRLWLNWQ